MLNCCIAYVLRKSSHFKNVYTQIKLIMLFFLKPLPYIFVTGCISVYMLLEIVH